MSLSSMSDILRDAVINNRAVKRFKILWSDTAVLLDGQGNEVIGDVRSAPGAHTVLQRLKDIRDIINPVVDTPESFEDTNFLTGESPVTLHLNGALGRNATSGFIINDGPGNFTVAFSTNGTDFGDEITRKSGEKLTFSDVSVNSFRITWVADSAYRVLVV